MPEERAATDLPIGELEQLRALVAEQSKLIEQLRQRIAELASIIIPPKTECLGR